MFERHLSAFDQTLQLELKRCINENPLWNHILTLLSSIFYTYTGHSSYGYVAARNPLRSEAIWRQICHLAIYVGDTHPYNLLTWISPSGVVDWSGIHQSRNRNSVTLVTSFLNNRKRSQGYFVDQDKLREATIYLLDIMRENL